MKKLGILAATAGLVLSTSAAQAQVSTSQTGRERLGDLLGAIFGGGTNVTGSLEAQWASGRTPLNAQRVQFESRVDTEIRTGNLDQASGQRLKSDYYALAQLEGRYGADGRFSTQERADLTARYNALTQVLSNGGYGDTGYQNGDYTDVKDTTPSVANGKTEFGRRVDAAVTARRITRAQATRLKADYAATVQLESSYLRDGRFSETERDDLDARLDALDVRVGDVAYGSASVTPRSRLSSIAAAIGTSGLSTSLQAQLRVEAEDLSRLESAYARLSPTADERAYLERRLGELEVRARVRR
jgi:hypothetical protein